MSDPNVSPSAANPSAAASPAPLRVAIGGDHAGFPLKQVVSDYLQTTPDATLVGKVIDCGANSAERSDYPDFAIAVSRQIVQQQADRGILICGSGVGVSVAANKIPGIRAAICHDTYSAHQGVEHDDMNVLCIGGRIIGSELALEIIRSFLAARYTPGERHQRRLDKVLQIEQQGRAALD
ncbi:ribose 5-phosphate isomerase B [Roseiconus nitratireducens]|uniref:Ribose 5-phosphate isomerase B n=1 Tax=Roseiconus nitratireducens TaxID=2605748 RepID=A0A5M6DJK8_9BACT|nr:ribose 5-phosphate isomerase B [Roseiconus nitratireducens]KAA5545475.1 ribose 5-phosphate isomerase B [Roseiconus nitratireducens]